MYSKHHAVISAVVGIGAVISLPSVVVFGVDVPGAALVAYAVFVGVFVDLDHFFIARVKTGTWDALAFCLRNPIVGTTDQDRIFSPGDVGVLSRLLSHLLIVGFAVPVLAMESVPLAVLSGLVLYVHIVCDVLWDIHNQGEGRREHADAERFETAR